MKLMDRTEQILFDLYQHQERPNGPTYNDVAGAIERLVRENNALRIELLDIKAGVKRP